MLVFDGVIEFVQSAASGFTRPLSVTSGIFLCMRVSSILTVMCLLMALFNDYKYIDCWDGTQLGLPANNHPDRAKWNYLKAASTFCYMQGSFVVVNHSFLSDERKIHALYGLGTEPDGQLESLEYYQWVPLALALLALCLRLPEMMWEFNENGITNGIVNGLDTHLKEDEVNKRVELSTSYFSKSLGTRPQYPLYMFFFEFLSVAVSWGSFYALDIFLDNEFIVRVAHAVALIFYGSYQEYTRVIYEVFPRVAKCTFRTFGSTGTLQKNDFICVLSLNVIYEKIFLVIWIYLAINAVLASFFLLCHLVLFTCAWLRQRYLMILSVIHDDRTTQQALQNVLSKTSLNDDILLLQLRSKMVYYSEWITSLNRKM